jgi:hypothetical protein
MRSKPWCIGMLTFSISMMLLELSIEHPVLALVQGVCALFWIEQVWPNKKEMTK